MVIATGAQRLGNVPPVSKKVGAEVFQVHTGDYRNPKQIPGSRVVVVGAANSGAQIATELAKTHRVTLSQGSPLPHFGRRFLGIGIHWWGDKLGIIKKPLIGERDRLHKKTLLVAPASRRCPSGTGSRSPDAPSGPKAVRSASRKAPRPRSMRWSGRPAFATTSAG
ncbi:hypothetical protein [Streptomyces yanii]|uniref:hypothetical protein n=1 Tax=Streptomyces yanii TaxID=78510 RepID=UPI003CD09BD6